MEKGAASKLEPFANLIIGSSVDNNLFCCVCCKPIHAATLNTHVRSYSHKICVERCKSEFDNRREKIVCKTCNVEIECKEIEHHALTHQIPPWCQFTKPSSKSFYQNQTVFFGRGYYFCYLCDKFLDYWDTAANHFMEADHKYRKDEFGPTVGLSYISYSHAIANGIVPGQNMTNECKMCNKTDLKAKDIEDHVKKEEHYENSRKVAANIFKLHEKQNDNMISKFTLQKVPMVAPDKTLQNNKGSKKLAKPIENLNSLKKTGRTNIIIGSEETNDLFCCACCQPLWTLQTHLDTYKHKVHMERFKSAFQIRRGKIFCRTCSFEIECQQIQNHASMHDIPIWCKSNTLTREKLFCNCTAKFGTKFYCFLCSTFLDFWDTAASHLTEPNHQKRKKNFGPTESIKTNYKLGPINGILPGKDMTNECKVCNIIGLKVQDLDEHVTTSKHKENKEKFIAVITKDHEEKQINAEFEFNSKLAFVNKITGSKVDNNLFCCVCGKDLKVKPNKHTRKYSHKIFVERFKLSFEDRGNNVFCNTCNCEIEWKDIVHHGKMHEIPPWSEITKPSIKTLFNNHTVHFDKGYYYCYLCEKFLDYWDTVNIHLLEADHQNRKENFGPTVKLSYKAQTYVTDNGIIPGRNMTSECKMCDKPGLKSEDIEDHAKTVEHIENKKQTATNILAMHVRFQEKSTVLETGVSKVPVSTVEFVKTDPPKEYDRPKNFRQLSLMRDKHEESTDASCAKSIVSTQDKAVLFCYLCRKYCNNIEKHLVTYTHKICVKRCETVFNDQGDKVYCKTCNSKIEWEEMDYHVKRHKIRPWYPSSKPTSQIFFHNRTIKFGVELYYCFLCEIFLEYWHTAICHFMGPNHQKWKKNFGPTELVETNYVIAINHGLVPGKDMLNECKMCDITGLKADNIKEHCKSEEHKNNKEKIAANISRMLEESQNYADNDFLCVSFKLLTPKPVEPDFVLPNGNNPHNIKVPCSHNMINDFSLKETSNFTSEINDSPKESSQINIIKNIDLPVEKCLRPNDDKARANKIIGSKADNNLFCCVCNENVEPKKRDHTRKYSHKILVERFKLSFEDRGNNVFCNTCNCEIEWKDIVNHGQMHEISPWSEITKPSSGTLFNNHTVHFNKGYYYCYLCDKFLDYWDTVNIHLMEADHQNRKEKFGPTVDLSNNAQTCAVSNGIVPGPNMKTECNMCDKLYVKSEDIEEHCKTVKHLKNKKKTAAIMFTLYGTMKDSEILKTGSLETDESKPEILKTDGSKEYDKPNNVESSLITDEQKQLNDLTFLNPFIHEEKDKTLYCYLCEKRFNNIEKHVLTYYHKIYVKRWKTVFENREEKLYCKTCNLEIEWKQMNYHVECHKIRPWCQSTKPNSQIYFQNHTVKFGIGFLYCFLCEKFLDYWDTAVDHFTEADHQKRKNNFGPTDSVETNYVLGITQGIVPGKDMMNECRICNVTGLNVDGMKVHFKTQKHKKNRIEFADNLARMHDQSQKYIYSDSNSVNCDVSTSKPLDNYVRAEKNKSQENSEQIIPETNESFQKKSENVCNGKTKKCSSSITMGQEKRQNYPDEESNSSKFEQTASELLEVELIKKGNNFENIEERENRQMMFNFSLKENSKSTPERKDSSKESVNVIKTFDQFAEKHADAEPCDNKIIALNAQDDLFCCVCNKKFLKAKLSKHTCKYQHKKLVERYSLTFEDRGEKVLCKICNSEIERKEIAHHGIEHDITPWSKLKKPNDESLYRNRTVHFTNGYYYCYLCEIFLDYWDTAYYHFMEPDHQERKENFGPTADLQDPSYQKAVFNGILPGPDMTYECKMCNETDLKLFHINRHIKTKVHRINRNRIALNMSNKLIEKQNVGDYECNHETTLNLSLQEENKHLNESITANKTFRPTNNSAIESSNKSNVPYCLLCCQHLSKPNNHFDSYKHKVYVKKFKLFFEYREREFFFCKTCNCEFKNDELKDHAEMHEIPPWTEQIPCAEIFFQNHTAKFDSGYCYCYLCEKFLDYWDAAVSHFKETDHENRKVDFGPVVDLNKFESAIAIGIAPGKNKMFDCKMCHVIGSRVGIKLHSKTIKHKENHEKFIAAIIKEHEESKKSGDSVSNTVASTSKPPKHVAAPNKDDNNKKKIQVPYSRNMICNFSLKEISVKEIPENYEITDDNEYTEIPIQIKPAEPTKLGLEPTNENNDWPIKYIVSSTSDLCKSAIVRTAIQRKKKIANQNPEEPPADPYCLICFSEIPGYHAVKDHLNGIRHETSRQKYGCDNILLIEGENYWCSACDGPVSGFNNLYRHIMTNSHLNAIVTMQQSNNDESENKSDRVKILMEAEQYLPCLYIVKQNAKKSFCQICDETQHPLATKNINDHIASQRHKISLKRYGCDNIVDNGNNNYYCKCCLCDISNVESVYLHIKEKKHMSSLIKVCNNNESKKGRRRIETQKLPEVLDKQLQKLISGYMANQINNKSLPSEAYETWQYDTMINSNVQSNHGAVSDISYRLERDEEKLLGNSAVNKNSGSFGFVSNNDFIEVKRKVEKSEDHGLKMSALEYAIESKKISCNVCGTKAQNTTELHVHMASHYSEEFVRFKPKRMKRGDESSHKAEQASKNFLAQQDVGPEPKISNGVAVNGFSNPTLESSNPDPIAEIILENDKTALNNKSGVTINDKKGLNKEKHCGKRVNMRKVTKLLDFDDEYIYNLDEKHKDLEFGMMLALVVDSSKMYCLICRNIVEYTLDNYYEHLENIDHTKYLEDMEADDALFHDLKDQFSDLALAEEYMEEVSNDKVRCVICDEDVKNNARSLQAHIYHEVHERKCEETRAIARKCFQKIKSNMFCSWYDVQKYWCVVCQSDTESEVNFMNHFKGMQHRKNMNKSENKNKRLIFDFCAACAVLWYGYRCTHAYHNDIDVHKWLQRDGHYVLTELPMHAKSLLASPDNFVQDKIKFIDEVIESERKREKWLIQDLEMAAKIRFPRSKAHLFGSRISGLGSPDSDIDVFIDCRNFYDGNNVTNDELLFYIKGVHQSLCKDPQLWDVDELLTDCRISIIKATHRGTELSCDVSFENGISVENSKLIRAFNQAFPLCRELTLFLKQWLLHCGLSGSRGITSYALSWLVIFVLQHESILPSVASLISMRRKSHLIAGWEVGVTHNFTYHGETSTLTINKLLTLFFTFYAELDFRYNVVCPLLGYMVKKREFVDPQSLPREMERYIVYMRRPGKPEPFRIDSPMCIQDPFDLQHNLTKAVNKVYLNRFKKCCAKSLEILSSS